MKPSAKIILDSLHPNCTTRLTTMEVVMHRFVLAEFNTHRVFSRNSASSRAIPVRKQLERVYVDPAFPISFPMEQPGMSGGEEFEGEALDCAMKAWQLAAETASEWAKILVELGVHKSVTNRLIEPFMWHTVIVTATDWQNFFDLRINEQAQPEIQAVATAMKDALDKSYPNQLMPGDWHLPYVSGYDFDTIMAIVYPDSYDNERQDYIPDTEANIEVAKQCSAARCARVSYLTHDGDKSIKKDLALAQRLLYPPLGGPMHASPFEHVAVPAIYSVPPKGNFTNFHQYRHLIDEQPDRF